MSDDQTDPFPSFNTKEMPMTLGLYFMIAELLFIIPMALLLVAAIVWNILVGFATKWMHYNAWKMKDGTKPKSQKKKPSSETTGWEEVFIANIKILQFLFGNNVRIKKAADGYLELHFHDYEVYMPLAMIFLQVCQLVVSVLLLSIFVETLVIQVSTICLSSVDCFYANETDRNTEPLDCNLIVNTSADVTCFHLHFDPIFAAAITGGIIKVIPIAFSFISFQYFKYITNIKKRFGFSSNIVTHAIVCTILEACFIGVGVIVLFMILYIPSVRKATYATTNPLFKLTSIYGSVAYFLVVIFLWCIYPHTHSPVRYKSAVWKKKAKSSPEPSTGAAETGSETSDVEGSDFELIEPKK